MDLFHIQMLFIVISFALTAFTALAPVLLVWRKSQQHHGGQVPNKYCIRCIDSKTIMDPFRKGANNKECFYKLLGTNGYI